MSNNDSNNNNNNNKNRMTNSVGPDETDEPSHQDLHCLQRYIL